MFTSTPMYVIALRGPTSRCPPSGLRSIINEPDPVDVRSRRPHNVSAAPHLMGGVVLQAAQNAENGETDHKQLSSSSVLGSNAYESSIPVPSRYDWSRLRSDGRACGIRGARAGKADFGMVGEGLLQIRG